MSSAWWSVKAADPGDRGEDLGHRGQLGAREDVSGDPARHSQVVAEAAVVDGDGVEQHRAVRRQQAVTAQKNSS